ncbi:hypothetical protein [Microcoleus sp. D2_18a_D3]|uniref:hypothetical protein n=1 Tax=Microcoleus sp. D2_18a_D3 TaxID=3055330 RepID=UPI002FD3E06F
MAAQNLRNLKTEIAGGRNITLLLAKLYVNPLIAKKKGTTYGNLAATIFELRLHYLNQINRSETEDKVSDYTARY